MVFLDSVDGSRMDNTLGHKFDVTRPNQKNTTVCSHISNQSRLSLDEIKTLDLAQRLKVNVVIRNIRH